jgi:histidinol-phosphatase (PHP family)
MWAPIQQDHGIPLGNSMTFGNFHTHTRYCDGRGEPREFAEAALRRLMPRIGFSGHNVLPFPTDWTMPEENLAPYLAEVRHLKAGLRDRLEVYLGLEVDYLPGVITPADPGIRALRLDYVVGSVHFNDPRPGKHEWTVDGTLSEFQAMQREGFGGNLRALVGRYYRSVAAMAAETAPDIVGHFDIVKKNNRNELLFCEEEPWYRAAVRESLEAVACSGRAMEVNTGGVTRGACASFYPSPWILREALELGIPVVVTSDAHRVEDLDAQFPEAVALLKGIGYRSQRQLTASGWTDTEL